MQGGEAGEVWPNRGRDSAAHIGNANRKASSKEIESPTRGITAETFLKRSQSFEGVTTICVVFGDGEGGVGSDDERAAARLALACQGLI